MGCPNLPINFWLTDSYLRAMKRNSFKKFYQLLQISCLIGKYLRLVKGMIADLFPDQLNAVVQLVLSLSLWFKFYCWFCHLDCHLLSIDAGCDGCHAWGRQHLLNPEHLVVLLAGPIPHNSIHLLIITTDFVTLYWFTGYVVFITTSFLASVESGDQCFCSTLKFYPVFWGHNEYKIVFFYFRIG